MTTLPTEGRTALTLRYPAQAELLRAALPPGSAHATLSRMVQFSAARLDRAFSAVSDANRRQILDHLGQGPASVSELAAPLRMSLPGVLKHLRALEAAHLVVTRKQGRTRWVQLGHQPLDEAATWIAERRALWERRLDRFAVSATATPAPKQ